MDEWMNAWMHGWTRGWEHRWFCGGVSEARNQWVGESMRQWIDESMNSWISETMNRIIWWISEWSTACPLCVRWADAWMTWHDMEWKSKRRWRLKLTLEARVQLGSQLMLKLQFKEWNEVRWHEGMTWIRWMNEMKEWNERAWMKWDEMTWKRMQWNGMKWHEIKWKGMNWNERMNEWRNGMQWD